MGDLNFANVNKEPEYPLETLALKLIYSPCFRAVNIQEPKAVENKSVQWVGFYRLQYLRANC